MRENLLHFFPFLKKEFRLLAKSELKSEKTFNELFPDEVIDLVKLKAIYNYQQIINDFDVVVTEDDSKVLFTVTVDQSKKKNAKV